MARPRKIDSGLVKQAQLLASRTDDIQELRMAQAVLLPALGQMTLKAAAKVIGVGRATVARLQTRFRRRKGSAPPTPRRWGGRRRALMKLEEEQAFLSAWKPKAEHGQLDWSLSDKMNTVQMAAFLSQVSQAHPQELLVMVVDGASSHKAKELIVPENVRLIRLPGYSPELNPQEHIWDEVREKAFPNLVLDRMAAVVERLRNGMTTLAADTERVRRITAWP